LLFHSYAGQIYYYEGDKTLKVPSFSAMKKNVMRVMREKSIVMWEMREKFIGMREMREKIFKCGRLDTTGYSEKIYFSESQFESMQRFYIYICLLLLFGVLDFGCIWILGVKLVPLTCLTNKIIINISYLRLLSYLQLSYVPALLCMRFVIFALNRVVQVRLHIVRDLHSHQRNNYHLSSMLQNINGLVEPFRTYRISL